MRKKDEGKKMQVNKLFKSKRTSNQQGYLMIDALLAIVIIFTVFAGVASMVTVSGKFLGAADDRSKAYSFAQERLELLKNPTDKEWQGLVPKATTSEVLIETLIQSDGQKITTFGDPLAISGFKKSFDIKTGNTIAKKWFTRRTYVSIPQNNTGTNLVQVRVEVEWTDSEKHIQRISVANFFERLSGGL